MTILIICSFLLSFPPLVPMADWLVESLPGWNLQSEHEFLSWVFTLVSLFGCIVFVIMRYIEAGNSLYRRLSIFSLVSAPIFLCFGLYAVALYVLAAAVLFLRAVWRARNAGEADWRC